MSIVWIRRELILHPVKMTTECQLNFALQQQFVKTNPSNKFQTNRVAEHKQIIKGIYNRILLASTKSCSRTPPKVLYSRHDEFYSLLRNRSTWAYRPINCISNTGHFPCHPNCLLSHTWFRTSAKSGQCFSIESTTGNDERTRICLLPSLHQPGWIPSSTLRAMAIHPRL